MKLISPYSHVKNRSVVFFVTYKIQVLDRKYNYTSTCFSDNLWMVASYVFSSFHAKILKTIFNFMDVFAEVILKAHKWLLLSFNFFQYLHSQEHVLLVKSFSVTKGWKYMGLNWNYLSQFSQNLGKTISKTAESSCLWKF